MNIGRVWRAGAQGIAFAVFGLGGGLFTVAVFPLIAWVSSDHRDRHKRVRYLIHRLFRLFVWFVQALRLFEIDVEGAEKLTSRHGCLIVANHPTLLDVVILMSLSPNFQCVVKHQLWRNFFLRGVVAAAGFIRNDLATDAYLSQCAAAFDAGYNLLVFPEGTRTVPGRLPKLVRGFANVAIAARADIQIVVIQCEPVTLTGDEPWYAVPESKPVIRVKIGDYWEASTFDRTPHRGINARHLARDLETYYHHVLSDQSYGA